MKSKILNILLLLSLSSILFAQEMTLDTSEHLTTQIGIDNRLRLAMSTEDYPVTPGDIYLLAFNNTLESVRIPCTVQSDYNIDLSVFGSVNGRGKTFLELSNEIKQIVRRAYPSSYPQLTISSLGEFYVQVRGEVQESKEVICWGMSRLGDITNRIKTNFTSLRDIKIQNGNEDAKTYDLFQSFRSGDMTTNPYLRQGDIVNYSIYERQVSVSGDVRKPGNYQLLAGETLEDVITYYGNGFTPSADINRIYITRITGNQEEGEALLVDSSQSNLSSITLMDRDRIYIPSRLELLPVVYFEGAVQTGDLEVKIYEDQGLYQTLLSVKESLSEGADLVKAFIQREGESGNIDVNLRDLLYNYSSDKDVVLKDGDRIVIPFGQYEVFITGEVIDSKWIDTGSLSRLSAVVAAELTDYSSTRNIEIESASGEVRTYDLFKARRNGDLTQNPYLMPGDIIRVQELERKIVVSGEVRRPGTYQLLEGETLEDLVTYYGGGYTDFSDESRIKITRYISENSSTGETIYIDLNVMNLSEVTPVNRDTVTIQSRLQQLPYVVFEGAINIEDESSSLEVSSKNVYNFLPGELLSSAALVLYDSNQFSNTSDLNGSYILRGDQHIPVPLKDLITGTDLSGDVLLQDKDVVVIPFKQYFVIVSGAVNSPGRYPYIPGRTYNYYINIAGGFDTTRNTRGSVDIVDMNNNEWSRDRIIQPEDMITAQNNNPLYQMNVWANIVGTLISVVSTTIAMINLF